MPAHPLVNCSNGSPNDPFCDFEWRIESTNGRLIERGVSRMPRNNERMLRRCTKCCKEVK